MIAVLVAALLVAQTPAADTVFTVDGGRVAGTVLEDSPTAGVTIQTPDGTVRRIERSQVARIEFADGSVSTPRAAAPAPAPTPAPAPAAPQPDLSVRPAVATTAGSDTIYLVPSGRVRGTVLEESATTGVKVRRLDGSIQNYAIDEVSRIELEDGETRIIWKRPNNVSFRSLQLFEVSSIGLFIKGDRLTLVQAEETPPFAERRGRPPRSVNELVLELLLGSVHHYLGHLKVIKQISRELQTKLATSMANEHLLKMFGLGESLTYYLNAIEANGAVLARMKSMAGALGFTEAQQGLLDDIIIENTQCARQTEIYSSVLAGLMDARASIINNNMNVLLRNLTLINVVFLPLNVLAGIGGMSEFSMMTQGVDWRVAYTLFLGGLSAIGVGLWIWLNRWVRNPRSLG